MKAAENICLLPYRAGFVSGDDAEPQWRAAPRWFRDTFCEPQMVQGRELKQDTYE